MAVDLTRDLKDRAGIGEVGSALVSETDRVRVWHILARPGERLKVHTHVLDYFWTFHGPGKARKHQSDGSHFDVDYVSGDTRYFTFAKGECMKHSLENIVHTDLVFATFEFKGSENPPLPRNEEEAMGADAAALASVFNKRLACKMRLPPAQVTHLGRRVSKVACRGVDDLGPLRTAIRRPTGCSYSQ